jgi:glutamate racemase
MCAMDVCSGLPIGILACNTASAKALRTIQQQDLKNADPTKRVLGVIRPTAEVIGNYTKSKQIGVLGTKGTVQSGSYLIEIQAFFPDVKVYQQACPLWVPLIENGEYDKPGADYFVKLNTLMKSWRNRPILIPFYWLVPITPLSRIKLKRISARPCIKVVAQGDIVAKSLVDYLHRHPEMETRLSKNGTNQFFTTTDDTADFDRNAETYP